MDERSAFNNKVDIWAMGCILYQLATGKAAFFTDGSVLDYYHGRTRLGINVDDGYDKTCKASISKIISVMINKNHIDRPSASELFQFFTKNYQEATYELSGSDHREATQIKVSNDNDKYLTDALTGLYDDIAAWCSAHFSKEIASEFTEEDVAFIKSTFQNLREQNNLIPPELTWENVDLLKNLSNPEFRVDFVSHLIGLHIHERFFSRFMYEFDDFGLNYWLKRIADELFSSGAILFTRSDGRWRGSEQRVGQHDDPGFNQSF